MSQTASEKKVVGLIRTLFASEISEKMAESLENVKIQMVEDSEDEMQAAMIIIMPLKILDIVQQNYTLFKKNIGSCFKKYTIFCVREPVFNKLAKTVNKNIQEKWIFDLCYPAEVQCRMTDIKNGGSVKIEKAMLERRCDFLQEDFKMMENAYRTLTNKAIIYSLRHF